MGSMGLPDTPFSFRVFLGNSKTTQQMCRSIQLGTYPLPPLQLSCVFSSVRQCHVQLYSFIFSGLLFVFGHYGSVSFFKGLFLHKLYNLQFSTLVLLRWLAALATLQMCSNNYYCQSLYQQQRPSVSIIRIFQQQIMQHFQTQDHYRKCLYCCCC